MERERGREYTREKHLKEEHKVENEGEGEFKESTRQESRLILFHLQEEVELKKKLKICDSEKEKCRMLFS